MHKKLLLYDLGNKNVQPNRLSSGLMCTNVRGEEKNEHKKWTIWRNVQWVEQVIDDEWQVTGSNNSREQQMVYCMCVL